MTERLRLERLSVGPHIKTRAELNPDPAGGARSPNEYTFPLSRAIECGCGSMIAEVGMRPKGSRNRLVSLTYDDIGRLVGIAGDTAKMYAQRGLFDSRDLDSALTWINARRAAKGLPLIGLPADNASDAEAYSDEDSDGVITPAPVQTGLLIYNPLTASYRVNDT